MASVTRSSWLWFFITLSAVTSAANGNATRRGRQREPSPRRSSSRKLHFVTFSDTLPHPGLCVLAEAINEYGGVLLVLGLSKPPGYLIIQNHSPTLKFLWLQEAMEYLMSIGHVHADDLMIFVDGHDVLLQRPLAELIEAYERFPDSPYLISGEANCWPWPHSEPSHGDWDPGMAIEENRTWIVNRWLRLGVWDFCRIFDKRGPYPFPNIGMSMGPVARFLKVLELNNRIVLDEDMNDQGTMWIVIARHALELNIQIDQNAEVFMNMLQAEDHLEREACGDDYFAASDDHHGTPPRNRLTQTTPKLLHFNGPSHEDDTWVKCYYLFSKKFHITGVAHRFKDIDHNILITTDQLCNYNFADGGVTNFHDFPLSNHAVLFISQLRNMPFDPGFLSWRGNNSPSDLVHWGDLEGLHVGSTHLRRALQGEFSGSR